MKQNKYDYTKCNKPEKHVWDNQICFLQSLLSNKCSIDKKICKANIKN